MRVIGVIGRKGGVGKTTVAVHLAAEYAARKRKVVVVDADMQGSATYWADPGALPVPVVHLPLEDASDVPTWSRDIEAMDADVVIIDGPPHLPEAQYETLRQLAFDQRRSQHSILLEGVDMALAKHGKG